MRTVFCFWAIIVLLSAGVGCRSQFSPSSPVGEKPTEVTFEMVVLRDVHPLWGGHVIQLQSDGTLWVQTVAQGEEKVESTARVPPEKVAELDALLKEHHFADIAIPERPGIPDEVRIEIEVHWSSGEHQVVSKWAGDTHPDFDAIYHWLIGLAEGAIGDQRGALQHSHND